MLKNKSELLQKENKNLFGKEFHEQISENVKVHKQSKIKQIQLNKIVGGNVLTNTTPSRRAAISTGVTSTMVNMQMKKTFFKEIRTLIPREKLPYAHKLVKRLFSLGQLPNVQISGRRKHFVKRWQFLTKDQGVLEIMKGYQFPFLSQPLQQQLPREIHLSLKEKSVVAEEIGNLYEKVCNRKTSYKKGFSKKSVCEQLISSKEKGWGQQTCHQFEKSKSVHSPPPFQNGEPAIIKRYPRAGKLHVQTGSKGCISLHPSCGGVEEIREILLRGGTISIPCIGLGPAPFIFTKLLKIVIAFLRGIGTLIIIYLDDICS